MTETTPPALQSWQGSNTDNAYNRGYQAGVAAAVASATPDQLLALKNTGAQFAVAMKKSVPLS